MIYSICSYCPWNEPKSQHHVLRNRDAAESPYLIKLSSVHFKLMCSSPITYCNNWLELLKMSFLATSNQGNTKVSYKEVILMSDHKTCSANTLYGWLSTLISNNRKPLHLAHLNKDIYLCVNVCWNCCCVLLTCVLPLYAHVPCVFLLTHFMLFKSRHK